MPKRAGFWQYVKTAFVNHWNLLAVGAGTIGAFLSGHPDVVLPIIAAGELAYLAGLTSHGKFRAHVDAQAHKDARQEAHETYTAPTLEHILKSLDPKSRARFERLRRRCRDLKHLSSAMGTSPAGLGSMQTEGVNKLLWVFLKLLYSRHSLQHFLSDTDEQEIQAQIADLTQKIEDLGDPKEDSPTRARSRHSLRDTLASATLRLDNRVRAKENFDFVELELTRIDTKVTSIAELAVNRQDPDFITGEVDGVAATMEHTERTMNELHLLDGLDSDAPPPEFVNLETVEIS